MRSGNQPKCDELCMPKRVLVGYPRNVTVVNHLLTLQSLDVVLTVVLTVAVIVQWRLLLALLRQNGRMIVRIESLERGEQPAVVQAMNGPGLAVGQDAPGFSLLDLDGNVLSLEEMLGLNRPILLAFFHSDCTECGLLFPEVAEWQRDYGHRVTVAVVAGERTNALAERARAVNALRILTGGSDVIRGYHAQAMPSAVLVGPDGKVASKVFSGAEAMRILLSTALRNDNGAAAMASTDSPEGSEATAR